MSFRLQDQLTAGGQTKMLMDGLGRMCECVRRCAMRWSGGWGGAQHGGGTEGVAELKRMDLKISTSLLRWSGGRAAAANSSTSALGSENVAMSWRSCSKEDGGQILWPAILSRTARCIFTGLALATPGLRSSALLSATPLASRAASF